MVAGILFVGCQLRHDAPAIRQRHPAGSRREKATNHRRRIVRGQLLEGVGELWGEMGIPLGRKRLAGQLHRPAADVWAVILEQLQERGLIKAAGRVHGPHDPQPLLRSLGSGKPLGQHRCRAAGKGAGSRPFLQHTAGMPHIPVVVVCEQLDELRV